MKKSVTIRSYIIAACSAALIQASAAPAVARQYDEQLLSTAGVISKSLAISIAKNAVGGGTVISAVFESSDHTPHWSVEIIGAKYEYEVWVSAGGSVLRIITQPK